MTAKVSDYGITRRSPSWNSCSDKTWTSTNVIVGTTVYMAPEYLTSGRVSDKIDAYSYGVVGIQLSCLYDDLVGHSFVPLHIFPVSASPGMWLGLEDRADFNSPGSDPSFVVFL